MNTFDNTSVDRFIKAIELGHILKAEMVASLYRWEREQLQPTKGPRKFVGGQRKMRIRVAKFNGWM